MFQREGSLQFSDAGRSVTPQREASPVNGNTAPPKPRALSRRKSQRLKEKPRIVYTEEIISGEDNNNPPTEAKRKPTRTKPTKEPKERKRRSSKPKIERDTLRLTLCEPWFTLMRMGTKREEFRNPTEWILSRLYDGENYRNYKYINFVNGYGRSR